MLIISVTQAPKNATPGKTPPGTTASSNLKALPPAGNSNGGKPTGSGVNPTTTTSSSTTQAGKPKSTKPTPAEAPKGNLLSSCVNKNVIKFFTT